MDGLPVAKVRHGAQIAELEGFVLEGALVERPCQVRSLLAGDLGRLGEVRLAVDDGAVTNHKDVVKELGGQLGARVLGIHQPCAESIIGDDAARLGILLQFVLGGGLPALHGKDAAQALARELLHQGVLHQARGPHDHTGGDLVAVPVAVLNRERQPAGGGGGRGGGIGADALDAVARLDGDLLAVKHAHGVVGEGLVKHGQNLGRNVVDGDGHVGHEGRVDARQVVVNQVV